MHAKPTVQLIHSRNRNTVSAISMITYEIRTISLKHQHLCRSNNIEPTVI